MCLLTCTEPEGVFIFKFSLCSLISEVNILSSWQETCWNNMLVVNGVKGTASLRRRLMNGKHVAFVGD